MCVSPLTSLMIDQRSKFTCISTEFVGELQTNDDAVAQVLKGQVQLVFMLVNTLHQLVPHSTLGKIHEFNLLACIATIR